MPSTKTLIVASTVLVFGLVAGALAYGPAPGPKGRPAAPPAADPDAKTKAIEAALDRPLVLNIPNKTTLLAVLKLIKGATAAHDIGIPGVGIPIYVDPHGLQEAGSAIDKPIDVIPFADKVPLRENLRQVLRPLGLDYEVQDELLRIDSRDRTVDSKIARLSDQLRKIAERLEAAEKRAAKE